MDGLGTRALPRRQRRIPEAVSAIVLKLMQKHPEQRYPSAAVLRGDLARLWPLALPPKAGERPSS